MFLEFSIFLFLISFLNINNIIEYKNKFFYSKLYFYLNLSIIFLLLFFFSIIFSFCNYDFSIMTIFFTSNVFLPVVYKIGAFWSTNDGSIILWNTVLWIYLLSFCIILNKNINVQYFKKFNFKVFIFFLIIVFFIYFVLFSNIFVKVNFYLISKKLITLNPILQDILLLFHPIFLYVGYIGLIMPCLIFFSFNIKNLNNNYLFNLYQQYKLFTWGILTIGLFLGSWWAYYELGWGGWWFWDPVENIALVPWGLTIILIHIVLLFKKTFKFETFLITLIVFNFFFSIIGTFLVRSGMLNSVHSFADLSYKSYYIFIILFIILGYICYFIWSKNRQSFYISKDFVSSLYLWMLYLMSIVLGIIVFGTFLPFLLSSFRQVSVGAHFFESLIVLFIIPLFLVMIYFLNLRYKIFTFYKEFIVGLLILLLIFNIIDLSFYNLVIVLSILVIIINLLIPYNNFMKRSHIIFSIFIICVLINSLFETNNLYYLIPGDQYAFSNFVVYYTNLFRSFNLENLSVISELVIMDLEKDYYTYFYPKQKFFSNNVFVFKSAINSNLLGDISVFLTKTEEQGSWAIRFKFSPLINGIWLTFILMILNIFLRFIKIFKPRLYWT